MTIGEQCICQEDEWYNAYGETTTAVQRGMRLHIVGTKRVGGCGFLEFKGLEGLFFLAHGFRPLRAYN